MAWGADSASQLEAIVSNRSTLVPISYLEEGLIRARSVARIVRKDGGLGTGFLIEGNRLVTNNHVLSNEQAAATAVVQFNYQKTLDGLDAAFEEFRFKAATLKTSTEDDWSVVELDGDAAARWGALALNHVTPQVMDAVTIIQHAGGGPKQISYIANVVVFVDQSRVQYLTDTLPGSSGSPVFDRNWNVVALHHSGGWMPEPGSRSKQPLLQE